MSKAFGAVSGTGSAIETAQRRFRRKPTAADSRPVRRDEGRVRARACWFRHAPQASLGVATGPGLIRKRIGTKQRLQAIELGHSPTVTQTHCQRPIHDGLGATAESSLSHLCGEYVPARARAAELPTATRKALMSQVGHEEPLLQVTAEPESLTSGHTASRLPRAGFAFCLPEAPFSRDGSMLPTAGKT